MNLAGTISIRIITDILAFCTLFILAGILQRKTPNRSGYFPDDYSIKLPYKHSSVSSAVLYSVSIVLIVLTILAGELIKYRNRLNERIKGIPVIIYALYDTLTTAFFGYVATIAIVDIGKVVIGRLRPNFYDVCKPTVLNTTAYGYVDKYNCQPDIGTEPWKSFPSGHSATAMFTAVYVCLYMQWNFSRIPYFPTVRPFLQAIVLGLGLGCCYSRVVDNKHHRTDVLAGGILGLFVAFSVPFYLTHADATQNVDETMEYSPGEPFKYPTKSDQPSFPGQRPDDGMFVEMPK